MIGIIGAMEEEVDRFRSSMSNRSECRHGIFTFIAGELYGSEVVVLQSGIGKVNAAIGTTLMIELFKPRFVLNTGSAGGIGPGVAIGDIVMSTEIIHHDVDVTAFDYDLGQVPQLPRAFSSDADLLQQAHQAVESADGFSAVDGLIISGDSFINNVQKLGELLENFPGAIAVEMESAAIAQTCHQFGVPFLVIRSISDKADESGAGDFKENLHRASVNSANTILELLKLQKVR